MQSAEKMLSLKWTSFPSQLAVSMDTCYEKQQFVDVSLVCKDGTILKCHKMILANASTFFSRLLVANDHPHPMIILHDIEADDLKTIVNFMYCGEIQVVQSEVRRLLRIANILEVTGLTQIQTIETGSPNLESQVFENVDRGKNNGPEQVVNAFNKSIVGQRFDSSGGGGGPRVDSNTRFEANSNSRFENNQINRFEVNSQKFEFNTRFDGNSPSSSGFRYDPGRISMNAHKLPRRDIVSPRRLETSFARGTQERKEFAVAQGTEMIQSNRLRLAKAGIDIQEGIFFFYLAHFFIRVY